MTEIKQHTKEWFEAKISKIGASEIFTLVAHYCKDELKQANIDLGSEKAFKTALESYIKVKFGIQDDSFSEVNRDFGLGMENYIIHRLSQEEKLRGSVQFQGSKDFVTNEEVNKIASCSPDGYVKFDLPKDVVAGDDINEWSFRDFDKKTTINANWAQGALELKTTQFTFNYEAEKGLKWGYIFQLQYQMLVCSKKWGILAALTPKEKRYDTDFFKGKTLKAAQILKQVRDFMNFKGVRDCEEPYEELLGMLNLDEYYNLYYYIYPENKTIQNLCILALKRFQKALDDNVMPNLSIDCKERLLREKKLLAQMYPERYGAMKADEELEGLLRDEREANTQSLKDKTERENYICEIIQKMGSHIELVGIETTAKFSKKGSLLFSKSKSKGAK